MHICSSRKGWLLTAVALIYLTDLVGVIRAGEAVATSAQPAGPLVSAPAQGAPIDSGDNAWVLASTALVLMMTAPGLILFYGGLVRRKNVLSTMMQGLILLAVVSMLWILFGYSLAFGEGNAFFGNPWQYFLLRGVGPEPHPQYAATIPQQSFMLFQLMFAIITPALMSGAVAERMKFSAYLLFTLLWVTVVYCPLAHMAWGIGGLFNGSSGGKVPVLDFAGGMAVHISSGVSALICALVLGRRRGYPDEPMPPHNVVLSLIGAGLLWVGWFGFTAGNALGAGALATSAFAATHFSAAAGALGWAAMEHFLRGKPSVLGTASGMVAGLAAITAASGFVTIPAAVLIGLAASVACYLAVAKLKQVFQYDDALDVFGIHAVGSAVGMLLLGFFASSTVHPALAGAPLAQANIPSLTGGIGQFFNQLIGVLFTTLYAALATLVLLRIVRVFLDLRVSDEDEVSGLDLTQHGESAYND